MSRAPKKKNISGRVVVISGPRAKDWKVQELDLASLEAMQKIVGGYIERFALGHGMHGIANEEGALKRLPFTCVVIGGQMLCGTVFVTGRFKGLTDAQILTKVGCVLTPIPEALLDEEDDPDFYEDGFDPEDGEDS